MTFNDLKTNCTRFANYRLKTRKVIELFNFQSLLQHSLSRNSMFYDVLGSTETLFWIGAKGQIAVTLKVSAKT